MQSKKLYTVILLICFLSSCHNESPYEKESNLFADFGASELKKIGLCDNNCRDNSLVVNATEKGFILTFYEIPDIEKAKLVIDDIYNKYQVENRKMELDLVLYSGAHKINKGFRETFYRIPAPIVSLHIAAKDVDQIRTHG